MVSGHVHDEVYTLAESMRDIVIFEKPLDNLPDFIKECINQLGSKQTLAYDDKLIEIVRNSVNNLLTKYFKKSPIVGRSQLNPLNTSLDSLRGYIPFHSQTFTGTLAVDLGEGFIDLFNRSVETPEPLTREDIAYEMANQLAGQFKSTLAEEGYHLSIGVPETKTLGEVQQLRSHEDPVVYIPAGFMGALFRIEFNMSVLGFNDVKKSQDADELGSGEMILFD